MDRRAYLSAVGVAALSGCTSLRPLPFEDVGLRAVERASAETTYDVALSVSVSIVRESITPDETARVELTVTWEGTETTTFDELPSSEYLSFDPPGLWLLRPDRDTERVNEATWVPAEESRAFQGSQEGVEYDPGESVSREYEVWANPYEEPWIRPGDYHSRETAAQRRAWSTPWDFEIEIVSADGEASSDG